MNDGRQKSSPPCIINEGTVFRKKDMLRALETLETVRFEQVVDGRMISAGQAIIAAVFASRGSATLLVNGYLYININSFDYVRFYINRTGQTVVELPSESMTLKLTAIEGEQSAPCRYERRAYGDDRYDEETFVLLDEESEEED
ncbi:MAG: hypothetical protein C4521_04170 [Actinobacteria bacterium]|nr:MAG: hypothetical protein C4521_04170 [Actinomycetota bacterium]